MSTHNTQFKDKIRKFPFIFDFMNYWKNFVGTKNQVQISHGKQVICVQAVDVWLKGKNKKSDNKQFCNLSFNKDLFVKI